MQRQRNRSNLLAFSYRNSAPCAEISSQAEARRGYGYISHKVSSREASMGKRQGESVIHELLYSTALYYNTLERNISTSRSQNYMGSLILESILVLKRAYVCYVDRKTQRMPRLAMFLRPEGFHSLSDGSRRSETLFICACET